MRVTMISASFTKYASFSLQLQSGNHFGSAAKSVWRSIVSGLLLSKSVFILAFLLNLLALPNSPWFAYWRVGVHVPLHTIAPASFGSKVSVSPHIQSSPRTRAGLKHMLYPDFFFFYFLVARSLATVKKGGTAPFGCAPSRRESNNCQRHFYLLVIVFWLRSPGQLKSLWSKTESRRLSQAWESRMNKTYRRGNCSSGDRPKSGWSAEKSIFVFDTYSQRINQTPFPKKKKKETKNLSEKAVGGCHQQSWKLMLCNFCLWCRWELRWHNGSELLGAWTTSDARERSRAITTFILHKKKEKEKKNTLLPRSTLIPQICRQTKKKTMLPVWLNFSWGFACPQKLMMLRQMRYDSPSLLPGPAG